MDREQLARQLIGPRGGLSTLKDDLIRLAHLLHVEVESNDTVPKLQKKVRPTVRLLMDKKAPATSTAMQPSSAPATSQRARSAAGPRSRTPAAPPRAEIPSTPSSWSNMNSAEAMQMEEKMKALLLKQEG